MPAGHLQVEIEQSDFPHNAAALQGECCRGANETSAADVAVGEGTDICGEFPDPEPQIFTVPENSPLFVAAGEYVLGADQAAVTFILYGNLADAGTADAITVLREVAVSLQSEVLAVIPETEREEFLAQLAALADACRAASHKSG